MSSPTENRGSAFRKGLCSSPTSAHYYFQAVKLLHHPKMPLEAIFQKRDLVFSMEYLFIYNLAREVVLADSFCKEKSNQITLRVNKPTTFIRFEGVCLQ